MSLSLSCRAIAGHTSGWRLPDCQWSRPSLHQHSHTATRIAHEATTPPPQKIAAAFTYQIMRLHAAQLAQRSLVLRPYLVLVALDEAQQRLMPHHRHPALVISKPHEVVDLRACVCGVHACVSPGTTSVLDVRAHAKGVDFHVYVYGVCASVCAYGCCVFLDGTGSWTGASAYLTCKAGKRKHI